MPVILVGTKTDLRRDQRTIDLLAAQGTTPITYEQGAAVARRIGARYIECSAKLGTGVREVFDLALKEAMKGRLMEKLKKKTACTIL